MKPKTVLDQMEAKTLRVQVQGALILTEQGSPKQTLAARTLNRLALNPDATTENLKQPL
jgi:hypothetical protein